MTGDGFRRMLDARAAAGRPLALWLRDDDSTAPTAALETLLQVSAGVPLMLAVIPAHSGVALADRLARAREVTVTVHGWAHVNHAGPGEKKQELGPHRPVAQVLADLDRGRAHLAALHGARFLPVLVPPWNRIDGAVVAGLAGIGFAGLSAFGRARPAPLPVINTHVDLIDWRGTGRAKPLDVLLDEVARAADAGGPVGFLTHHLVHDGAAWDVVGAILSMTTGHPGCDWVRAAHLLPDEDHSAKA
jgi:hypothetical protein